MNETTAYIGPVVSGTEGITMNAIKTLLPNLTQHYE